MFRTHCTSIIIASTVLLVMVGCSENQNPVHQYGKEVIQAHERTQRVKAQADMRALKTSIEQYYIEWGRFPASLNDLPLITNQGIDTDLYVYDPATGDINLR
jgi:hypothetical protein